MTLQQRLRMHIDHRNIRSITRISSNEQGLEELSFVREVSFLELVSQVFCTRSVKAIPDMVNNGVTETFIYDGYQWVEKSTMIVPDWEVQEQLLLMKHYLQRSVQSLK